jgi:DNA invertase Pin-like site-specific DNA recombinase
MIDPLQQLYVDVTEIADDLNIDCVQAVELAKRLTNQVQERYRGQRLYIRNFNRQQRNDAIRRASTRHPAQDVCKIYSISERTLYRILQENKPCSGRR